MVGRWVCHCLWEVSSGWQIWKIGDNFLIKRGKDVFLKLTWNTPKKLHDLHNEYPLVPERIEINKVEKLIPNLNEKKKCSSAQKFETIFGSRFETNDDSPPNLLWRKAWLKPYIELNTNLRSKAQNEFEKDFFWKRFFQTREQQRLWQDDGKYPQPGEYSVGQ